MSTKRKSADDSEDLPDESEIQEGPLAKRQRTLIVIKKDGNDDNDDNDDGLWPAYSDDSDSNEIAEKKSPTADEKQPKPIQTEVKEEIKKENKEEHIKTFKYYEPKDLSDVTLIFRNWRFYVHKTKLLELFDYFRSLHKCDRKAETWELSASCLWNESTFELFLNFIYTPRFEDYDFTFVQVQSFVPIVNYLGSQTLLHFLDKELARLLPSQILDENSKWQLLLGAYTWKIPKCEKAILRLCMNSSSPPEEELWLKFPSKLTHKILKQILQ